MLLALCICSFAFTIKFLFLATLDGVPFEFSKSLVLVPGLVGRQVLLDLVGVEVVVYADSDYLFVLKLVN